MITFTFGTLIVLFCYYILILNAWAALVAECFWTEVLLLLLPYMSDVSLCVCRRWSARLVESDSISKKKKKSIL